MDINQFLQDDPSFSGDPMFVLKPMEEKDKQDYMQLVLDDSTIKGSSICERVWEEMWTKRISENIVTYSILSPKGVANEPKSYR